MNMNDVYTRIFSRVISMNIKCLVSRTTHCYHCCWIMLQISEILLFMIRKRHFMKFPYSSMHFDTIVIWSFRNILAFKLANVFKRWNFTLGFRELLVYG